jgi:hypothetical protein
MRALTRKLRFERSFAWQHHRDGWRRAEMLIQQHAMCNDGVLFVSAVEDQLVYRKPLQEPWVGVLHQVPHHNLPGFPDLDRFLQLESWQASEPHCLGLWTLSDYARRFLLGRGIRVSVGVLPYPTSRDVPTFDYRAFRARERPRLLHVGEFLRNFQAFFDLSALGWQKQMLEPEDWAARSATITTNASVELLPTVEADEYDRLLTESVVFLHLDDAPANTTIVECIARATPVCVNRVGGVEEYLGRDYPLYHDGDAPAVLADPARIRRAHEYLFHHRDHIATDDGFLAKLKASAVYVALPVPSSQAGNFRRFSLTVLIAVYARLYNLREQLRRLTVQEGAPAFEILIWNNDPNNSERVHQIVAEFSNQLTIRVIDSSENVYCTMRLAVPAIARSDVLLICDDDVLPNPAYVRTLWDAHLRLGPDAVVCLRGHIFSPHPVDFDDPDGVWRKEEHVVFHDQGAPEVVVDFAHADNMVISMDLLRRAALHPMTHPEYALVDDYWLSYVLSANLGVKCHKIEAGDVFAFTDCADDPSIALYRNASVHEQRVRLYLEHMLAGWPRRAQLRGTLAPSPMQTAIDGRRGSRIISTGGRHGED